MLGEEIFSLGEVIHGSKKEKEVLRLIENSLPLKARKVEITTREWMIKNFSFKINGKEVKKRLYYLTLMAMLKVELVRTLRYSKCQITLSKLTLCTRSFRRVFPQSFFMIMVN